MFTVYVTNCTLSCGAMPIGVANDWSSITLCRMPPQHDRVQYSGGDKHPKQREVWGKADTLAQRAFECI